PVTSGTVSGGSASATMSLTDVNAGSYSLYATYNAAASSPNFAGSTAAGPATVIINAASQTITFATLADKTYGAGDFAVSATSSASLAVDFSTETPSVCGVSGTTVHLMTAGTCTIRASQTGSANYAAAADVDRSFGVSKAALTVVADDKGKGYGAANPAL